MSGQTVVRVGENSPEYVAFRLMKAVMIAEEKSETTVTRKWIYQTYAECLRVVRGDNPRQSSNTSE